MARIDARRKVESPRLGEVQIATEPPTASEGGSRLVRHLASIGPAPYVERLSQCLRVTPHPFLATSCNDSGQMLEHWDEEAGTASAGRRGSPPSTSATRRQACGPAQFKRLLLHHPEPFRAAQLQLQLRRKAQAGAPPATPASPPLTRRGPPPQAPQGHLASPLKTSQESRTFIAVVDSGGIRCSFALPLQLLNGIPPGDGRGRESSWEALEEVPCVSRFPNFPRKPSLSLGS